MSGLFARECYVLETDLTQEECVRRLKPKVRGMFKTEFPTPEQPFYGEVTSSSFALQFWPRRPGNSGVNPFYFRGVFIPGSTQTTIRATYSVSNAYRLFITGLVSFFLTMGWLIGPFHFGMPASLQMFFGIVIFFVIYYCCRGVGWMKQLALVDREPIISTVAGVLEARIIKIPEAVLRNPETLQ